MRTGQKRVPTKIRLEVTFSFFPPLGRVAESSDSRRVPLNRGFLLDHLSGPLATDLDDPNRLRQRR